MGKHEIARAAVETLGIGEKRTDCLIRKMAGAAHDALFDVPRVGTDLQHLHIVIGFEHQAIAIAQVLLYQFGHVTEIGHQRKLHPGGAKREAERVDGVVGNTKRRDFDIAHAKSLTGLDEFDAFEAACVPLGKKAQRFGVRLSTEIYGSVPFGKQRGETADMIGVFVRDENTVEAIDRMRKRGEAPQRLALPEPGIHQQARPGSLEQGAIARTARRENAHAKADGLSPGIGRDASPPKNEVARMMAKPGGRRQYEVL